MVVDVCSCLLRMVFICPFVFCILLSKLWTLQVGPDHCSASHLREEGWPGTQSLEAPWGVPGLRGLRLTCYYIPKIHRWHHDAPSQKLVKKIDDQWPKWKRKPRPVLWWKFLLVFPKTKNQISQADLHLFYCNQSDVYHFRTTQLDDVFPTLVKKSMNISYWSCWYR